MIWDIYNSREPVNVADFSIFINFYCSFFVLARFNLVLLVLFRKTCHILRSGFSPFYLTSVTWYIFVWFFLLTVRMRLRFVICILTSYLDRLWQGKLNTPTQGS